jgi:hypothetical protein
VTVIKTRRASVLLDLPSGQMAACAGRSLAIEGSVMVEEPLSVGEWVVHDLLQASHLAPPDSLGDTIARHAQPLGVHQATIYLADLQQLYLTPLPNGHAEKEEALSINTTLPGLSYRTVSVQIGYAEQGRSRMWLPIVDGTERLGVLELVVDRLDEPTLRRLSMLASLVSLLVVSKGAYSDTYARVRRTQLMSLPAEMEWAFMPARTFATDQIVISAALEPAYAMGGDAFDYSLIGDTLHLSTFDAIGHDLSAGLIASVGMASCRNTRRAGLDLPDMVTSTDQVIAGQFGEDRFLTALLCHLHLPSGQLRWINCGYPPPLLIRHNKPITVLDQPPRPPLGLGDAGIPVVHEEWLQPGDRLLFYSDGVTEARSAKGELFGLDQLSNFVVRNTAEGAPAPEALRRLTHAILEHQRGQLSDDATVIFVEWRPTNQHRLIPHRGSDPTAAAVGA